MGLALFAGGWVTTQLTAGETKCESVVYGILTWATVTALSLYAVGMGVRAGYHGLLGSAYIAQSANPEISQDTWEVIARRSGVSQAKIDEVRREGYSPEKVKELINDPENREAARKAAMMSIWTALVGTILAIACAVGGALVGSGPEFRLIPTTRVRQQEVALTR